MEKAMIIYQSKKGTTRQFGTEIGNFLKKKGVQTEVLPLNEVNNKTIKDYDYLFLGCWTKGLMIINQHPDKAWKEFAETLEVDENMQVNLFTTYKLATGSMFSRMKKSLRSRKGQIAMELKSRNGSLSDENAWLIDEIIQ
jgi:flavodoxin